MLQTKGLKCLRPEEGDGYQGALVYYDDKGTAEPLHKAEPRLRVDVISSALKVFLFNSALLRQTVLLVCSSWYCTELQLFRCMSNLTVLPAGRKKAFVYTACCYTLMQLCRSQFCVRATHTFWDCAC